MAIKDKKLIAKQIMEQLSEENLAYARSAERGQYRGFAALHDLFDANMFVEDYVDDMDFCNEVISIVNDLILEGKPVVNKHEDSGRGFVWSSHAWYAGAADCKHKISFGLYHKDGGTTGEMEMVWHEMGEEWVPRLECFDDGWSALSMFTDLLEEMAMFDGVNVTEEGFVKMLQRCQFADITPYEKP